MKWNENPFAKDSEMAAYQIYNIIWEETNFARDFSIPYTIIPLVAKSY